MKRGLIRIVGSMLMAVAMIAGCSVKAYAARKITWDNFDYVSYANKYSDLLDAFGYDKNSLYNHYINNGIGEGRVACAVRPNSISVFKLGNDESYYFDAARYAEDYPDVKAAFGNNKSALWEHYKTFGIMERRKAYGTTDTVNAKLAVYSVAYSITNDSMTEREKIKAVHDWIVNHTVYDYQNYLNGTIPSESYGVEGVMLKGTGVCAGYAKTFDYFMYVLGIEDEYVSGTAYGSDGSSGGHAWNRVLIDDNWLYVDCTWDDPICFGGCNMIRYNYFLISYEKMSKDHVQEDTYTLDW